MGLYSSGLARLGMLSSDSLRACRLVIDTGLHARGWSREEAVEFLFAHAPLSRSLVEAEIDRYICWPGQATSYMVGRLTLDRLRTDGQTRLGSRFDIRDFTTLCSTRDDGPRPVGLASQLDHEHPRRPMSSPGGCGDERLPVRSQLTPR
jgi:uncharacterized protein (DUF885 family)